VIVELPEIETIECVDHNVPATQVEGGPATDQYALVNRYRGDSQLTDGFGKSFKSYHFSVVSEGIAPRSTRVEHHQGAYIVNHSGNQDSFSPLQANLLPAPCP
jgi:hypothetical protein